MAAAAFHNRLNHTRMPSLKSDSCQGPPSDCLYKITYAFLSRLKPPLFWTPLRRGLKPRPFKA